MNVPADDLLPCPFCGSPAAYVGTIRLGVAVHRVECAGKRTNKHAWCMLMIYGSTREEAEQRWNTRYNQEKGPT